MAEDEEDDIEVEAPEQSSPTLEERDAEWCNDDAVNKQCLEIFTAVEKGFQDQWERANSQMDYWDIFNCNLGPNQFYSGNSKVYAPFVHDAIEARKTRFVNQIFPVSGKHVDVTASEDKPSDIVSLMEHYIRKAKLRTRVMPALMRNGDVEGQYNLYVSWVKNKRHVAYRVEKKPQIEEMPTDEGEPFDDIQEETIEHAYPLVEVVADMDVLVLPATADSIEAAIDAGGSATLIRRWSKYKIKKLIRDGEIDKEQGQALLREMAAQSKSQSPSKQKAMTDAAGVKTEGGKNSALVYETWANVKIDDEWRLCKMLYGGEERVLSCRRNPFWCDKVPILSEPEEKVEGSFKGVSKVKYVETFQLASNDILNEAMDSAAFALMPIVMTDPLKNPNVNSMVLNVAAVWQTSPKDTQFAQFPMLFKEAMPLLSSFKDQIFQTLSVNPAMMPQQATAPGKRPNQAQIANEQQVDILTTADAVTVLEGGILTPLLQWFLYLDHQFRDKELTVRQFGEMGVRAEMERIKPVQMDRRYEFRWFGVEAARSAQQVQVQMAGLNVLRSLGPQDYPGYEKNLAPIISQFVENTFGARLAPEIFKDIRKRLSLEPQFENGMLEAGYDVYVSPMDNDVEHMQIHAGLMQEMGDPTGAIRTHMIRHQMAMQQKQQAQMMQQVQTLQGAQGAPGGAGPGVAGRPRVGAVPAPGRGQQPPGVIHQDRMHAGMPRAARG